MKFSLLLIIALLGSVSCLIAQEHHAKREAITVEEYSSFLNSEERLPQYDLDEIPDSLMMRSGTVGSYHYEITPGEEKAIMTFLSGNDVASYTAWKNVSLLSPLFDVTAEVFVDPYLKSNHLTYYLVRQDAIVCQASGEEVAVASSDVELFYEALAALLLMEGTSGKEQIADKKDLSSAIIAEKISDIVKHPNLEQHYLPSDTLWNERAQAWQRHQQIHHDLEQRRVEVRLAKEKLEQAATSNTEEAREQAQLGKILKAFKKITESIGELPLPPVQIVVAGVKGVVGMMEIAQQIWTKTVHVLAEKEYQKSCQHFEEVQAKAAQANFEIIAFEEKMQQTEEACLEAAENDARRLALSLHPHAGSEEMAWRDWGKEWLRSLQPQQAIKEEELQQLLSLAPHHLNAITKITAELWQQRIEQSNQAWKKLERMSSKETTRLQKSYNQYKQRVEQSLEATTTIYQQLVIARERKEKLKQAVEEFLEQQLEEKRERFCDNFKNLTETQHEIERLQGHWKEKLQEESCLRHLASKARFSLESEKKKYARFVHRAKAAFQIDQGLLRLYWPESDITYRPYLSWSLPFQQENGKKEALLSFDHEKEIEPPLIPQEELEARGRRYYFEEEQRVAAALAALEERPFAALGNNTSKKEELPLQPELEETRRASESEFESYEETTSLSEEDDLYQELLEWSRAYPSLADKQRGKIFKQLQRAEQESRDIATRLQQAKKEEELETGSVLSAATQGRRAAKVSSVFDAALSLISDRTTKTALVDEQQSVLFLGKQFMQAQAEEERLLKQYLHYVDEAEKRRIARGGKVLDQLPIVLWREIDKALLEEQRVREEILLEKQNTLFHNTSRRWNSNVTRWNVRKETDHAAKDYLKRKNEIEDQLAALAMQTELDLVAKQEKKKRLQEELQQAETYLKECENTWESLAREHRSVESLEEESPSSRSVEVEKKEVLGKNSAKAIFKLKEADRAVIERWYELEERLKREQGEEALAPDEIVMEKNPASFETVLTQTLEQERKKAFEKVVSPQFGVTNYRQAVKEIALRMARENKVGTAIAWERRVQAEKEKLAHHEQTLQDPNTAYKVKLELGDLLSTQRGMVEAERQGEKIFKKEQARLSRIEQLWKSLLEAENLKRSQRAVTAAKAYEEGNHLLWKELTLEEREAYNRGVELKDNRYRQQLGEEERELEEIQKGIETEQAKIEKAAIARRGFFGAERDLAQETSALLAAAQTHYQKRKEALEERQARLTLGKMSQAEREQRILYHEKIIDRKRERAFQEACKAKEKIEPIILMVWQSVMWGYQKANEAAKKRNYNAARCYQQRAIAYEAQVKALINQEEGKASGEEVIASAWRSAAEAYEKASEATKEKNNAIAQCYQQRAIACEAQARVLILQKKEKALRQEMIASAWRSAAEAYEEANKAKIERNYNAARCYQQRVIAYEAQVKALINQEEEKASIEEVVASAWRSAAEAYEEANKAKIERNYNTSRCYQQRAIAYEAQVKALINQEEEKASIEEVVASTWKSAAEAYEKAIGEDRDVARCLQQCGIACEARARALAAQQKEKVSREEKIASVWSLAVKVHRVACRLMTVWKKRDIARCSYLSAIALEAQARALLSQDDEEAIRQEKIAKAWGDEDVHFCGAAKYYYQSLFGFGTSQIATKYEAYAMALTNRAPEEELNRMREELEELEK